MASPAFVPAGPLLLGGRPRRALVGGVATVPVGGHGRLGGSRGAARGQRPRGRGAAGPARLPPTAEASPSAAPSAAAASAGAGPSCDEEDVCTLPVPPMGVASPDEVATAGGATLPGHPRFLSPADGVGGTRPNIVDVLRSRGLVDAVTGEGDTLRDAAREPLTVYVGFDPTADSLHLGNLLGILTLAWFARAGHKPVALVGGATGRVGDPSGRSSERPLLDSAAIQRNLDGIAANIRQVLDGGATASAGEGEPVTVLNNHDWLGGISFLDFLRDVGKHTRVSGMLAKDSVRTRLASDDGMSFTEFTYQLLQAYDFTYLSDPPHNVRVQAGGSDQWGNITAGTELTRKLRGGRVVHGLVFPLLTRSDGKKVGKSDAGGATWLTASKLSPYEFYQHLVRVPDADVVGFLRSMTFLPLEEVDAIAAAAAAPGAVPNGAQRRLAEEVTRLVHGEAGVAAALAATAVAAPGRTGAGADTLTADALEAIAADVPGSVLTRADVVGRTVVDVMAAAGIQSSKGEARRLIKNGGGYINNVKVPAVDAVVSADDIIDGRLLLLGAGKKNKMLVRVEP
ncbi:hypothetical protein MMPV_007856 [Pyropia vietnamensis]